MPTVAGVIGSSVASLEYLLRSLLSTQPWTFDPDVLPLPWRKLTDIDHNTRLSFGFMEFDGIVKPHLPISRALNIVADALRASGHEVWQPPSILITVLTIERFFSGNHRRIRKRLKFT